MAVFTHKYNKYTLSLTDNFTCHGRVRSPSLHNAANPPIGRRCFSCIHHERRSTALRARCLTASPGILPKQRSPSLSITPRSWYTKRRRTCRSCLQRSSGIMDMYDTRTRSNHTTRQLWFPPGSCSKPAEGGFVETPFNTDVKMRAAGHSGRRMKLIFEMFISCRSWLTGRQALTLNPPCLSEHVLNDKVVTQLNLSSCSCRVGFCKVKGVGVGG